MVALENQRSVARFGTRGGGRVTATGANACGHSAGVRGCGGLGHGGSIGLRDSVGLSATGNGRDLKVAELNQISHLVDSLVRLKTGKDRTPEASPQERQRQSKVATSASTPARGLTRLDVMSKGNLATRVACMNYEGLLSDIIYHFFYQN
jgi:hypothetical protein